MAVGMAAAIVLAALAAWAAARMIERRLEDTVATANAVAGGDLSRRVVPKGATTPSTRWPRPSTGCSTASHS
ncbi:hypothetical protein P0F65_02940 [Sphingomonas sp. I4]